MPRRMPRWPGSRNPEDVSTAILARSLRWAAALGSFWLLPGAAAFGKAGADGLSLIAQAMRGKHSHTFEARQEIWFSTGAGGPNRMVADLAREGRRTRLVYREPPSMAGRVRVDDGEHLFAFDANGHGLRVEQSVSASELSARAERLLALLGRNYRCVRLRREAVSGRACDLVALYPKHGAGGAYRLCWIDQATRTVLRTEDHRPTGDCVYVSFYRQIRFVSRLPIGVWALPPAARTAARRHDLPLTQSRENCAQTFAGAGIEGEIPCWSPCGFGLVDSAVLLKRPGGKAAVLHFSDGLKSLTVFEERRTAALSTPERQQERLAGPLSRLGEQVWVRDYGELRMTVLGDQTLPPALGAEMMAALDPQSDRKLRQALGRDFGGDAPRRAADLRRLGWGYDQIAALLLSAPSWLLSTARLHALARRERDWPGLARVLRLNPDAASEKAQRWVGSVVGSFQ